MPYVSYAYGHLIQLSWRSLCRVKRFLLRLFIFLSLEGREFISDVPHAEVEVLLKVLYAILKMPRIFMP